MSKPCCALFIIVSIGSAIMFFLLFSSFVIEKSCIFLSLVFTFDMSICASCNFKLSLRDFFSTRNFKKSLELISFKFVAVVLPEK